MRILLVEPSKSPVSMAGEDYFIFEPLALEYLGAGLKGDHDVRILDMRFGDDLLETLDAFRPDIVGITGYTVHVKSVKRLFEAVKEWDPNVYTVVGGHHATVVPEDFNTPSIDCIVIGEGVAAFREIVRRREKDMGPDGIPGVAVKENDGLTSPAAAPLPELDRLPFPDRALTTRYRDRYYSQWMKPLASLRTSKGCPYRCSFCVLWKLTRGRYLKRNPDCIVEELAAIGEPYVFFADDESLVDAERMKALARKIQEAGIRKRFYLYGRSDTIARNPELLALWKDAGLEQIFVGLESFRDEDLRSIRKNSTTDDNRKAIRVLNDLGIDVHASLIIHPEFGRDDFRALIDYCHDLDLSYAGFAVLTPLPGTDLYDETRDHLLTHDYDLYDFIHTVLPTRLPMREFYREYIRLYQRAMPRARAFHFVLKHSWKDIPGLFVKSYRWTKRLRSIHEDYTKTTVRKESSENRR